MNHCGVQQSLLEGPAVVALVDPSSKLSCHSRPLAPLRLLGESQALKVVVLVHSLILREAGCSGKVATVKLWSLKSSVVRLGGVGRGSAVLQPAVVGVE